MFQLITHIKEQDEETRKQMESLLKTQDIISSMIKGMTFYRDVSNNAVAVLWNMADDNQVQVIFYPDGTMTYYHWDGSTWTPVNETKTLNFNDCVDDSVVTNTGLFRITRARNKICCLQATGFNLVRAIQFDNTSILKTPIPEEYRPAITQDLSCYFTNGKSARAFLEPDGLLHIWGEQSTQYVGYGFISGSYVCK